MELSDAPDSLLSTAKSSVCMYLHTHACVLLPMMEDLALHEKVRNTTSFPFFSTQNIFIFFCISSRFPWFVKPTGQDPELLRTAKPTALGRMVWIAGTSHTIQPSLQLHQPSSSQSSASYWFGSSPLSIYIFVLQAVSKHLRLHPVPWAPCPQLCQRGSASLQALQALRRQRMEKTLLFFCFFLFLCFSGSTPR